MDYDGAIRAAEEDGRMTGVSIQSQSRTKTILSGRRVADDDGESHYVTVTISDRGIKLPLTGRFSARVEDDLGRTATGSGSSSMYGAVRRVHWFRLDGRSQP